MNETKMNNETVIWWEKTVEYKFIFECFEKGVIKKISPLAGHQEKVGDAISILENTLKENKFYIIEFKATLSNQEFNKELDKFPGKIKGYSSAQACFNTGKGKRLNKSHYFIAAKYENKNFQLFVRDYFATDDKKIKSLEEALSSETGMTQDEFKDYVLCFTTHKQKKTCYKCSNTNEGGSAAPDPDDGVTPTPGGNSVNVKKENVVSMVVAINPGTKECTTFPLEMINIKDEMGGQSQVMDPARPGGPCGGGIFENPEVIITYTKLIEPSISDLSRPDDVKEEVIG